MVSETTDEFRKKVVCKIAGENAYQKKERVTYTITGKLFHVKVKTGNSSKYPFNINDAVLEADYEVLICGTDNMYFVIPIELIKKMHKDPSSMPDSWHDGYTIYDVIPKQNIIVYGTGGKSVDVTKFRNLRLNPKGEFAY